MVTSTNTLLATAFAAVALPALLLTAAPVSAEDARLEVAGPQIVTLDGTFDSLAELVADLCAKADVELRAYDAPDRRITGKYVERPLIEVLERLLAEENYLLGIRERDSPGQPARIAWIRVTGAKGEQTDALPGGLTVPSRFGATDFQSEDPTDTDRAAEAVAARLLADEATVERFLHADPRELARSLRQYPHIDALLRKLRTEQQRPEVVEMLDAVLAELATGHPIGPD